MQENFEDLIPNNNSIKYLLELDNEELDELYDYLCDYLLNFLKKNKNYFQVLDKIDKILAVFYEVAIMYIIKLSFYNTNNFKYLLSAFMLGICIIVLNEVYNNIQNNLKFIKSLECKIKNKNLKFLNKFIDKIEKNDGITNIIINTNVLLNEFSINTKEDAKKFTKKAI